MKRKRFPVIGGLLVLAGSLVLVGLLADGGSTPVAAEDKDGKTLLIEQKCNMCHAVSSAGIEAKVKAAAMQGPDLTGVGQRHDAKWLASYVKQDVDLEGKKHKKEYKGSDEELQAIVSWLATQKDK